MAEAESRDRTPASSSAPGLDIREVDAAAAEAAALVVDFFSEVASRYPGFDPRLQPVAPLDAFRREHGGAFLVAFRDGDPVACAGVQRLDATTCEVRRVFVRASARGEGFGRALLAALLDAARDRGYVRARLDTGDRLPEARSLFVAFGFEDIDDYNGNPYASYWMELVL